MGIGEGAFGPFLAGLERASSATQLMADQVGRVADAWGAATAAVERYGSAAGVAAGAGGRGGPPGGSDGAGGGGGTGGRGRPGGAEREAARQLAEDRRNAEAINRNETQIYSRQEAAARRENAERDRMMNDGPIGPIDRPYWGENDDWANAHAENRNDDAVRNAQRREAEYENNDRRMRDRESSVAAGAMAGHVGGVLHGMAPLVAGVAGFEAEKSAMEEQIALKQALIGINITDDMPEYAAAYERLQNLAYTSTKGTKFSNVEAAKTLREALPVLAMEGNEALNTADQTFPIALRLGELSSHRGKGTIGSEAVAAEEFAHLEQNYEPKHMVQSLDQINAIAMKNDTSVRAQLNIMKYGIPTAMMAGIDPEKAAGEIGAAELRMGATTTAGTGYSQWLLGGMIFKGKAGAGQSREHQQRAHAAEHELENALKLQSPEAARTHVTSMHTDAHDAALVRLGIFSKQGDLLAKTATGGYDEDRVKVLMAEYAASHSREDTIATMAKAFETRGARFGEAFLNPEMIEREKAQIQTFKNAPPVEKELAGLSGTAMQQFEQMLANISNTGNILATQTLPGLNAAFQTMNTALIGFNTFLREHKGISEVAGYGALGAAGAGALGLAGAGVKALWRFSGARAVTSGISSLLGGGGGAAGGAAIGEEALAGLGTGSLLGPMGLLGGGMLAAGAAAGAMNAPMVDDFGRPVGTWGGRPSTTAMPPPSNTQMTVTLGPVTMNGVPDDSVLHALLAKLTSGLRDAMSHMTSDPGGPSMSAFTQPGGF